MFLQTYLTSPAGKWLGFVTAIWVQAISGNNYTFSNYSQALKTIMKLTQLQLNSLSVAKDVGKAFGLLAGIASDRVPLQVILLIGLLIGGVEGLLGYGVQWLVVSQTIKPIPYWVMCLFLCMGGNSTTWMNTAILVTCIRNFKKSRGPVSGILKGYVGLSTAIFTDICAALFLDSPSAFLVLLATVPLAVCLTAILFLRQVPPITSSEDNEIKCFGIINILSVLVALYLLAYDVSGTHGRVFNLAFAIILLFLLALPLVIPLYLAVKTFWSSNASSINSDEEYSQNTPFLEQERVEDELENNQTTEELDDQLMKLEKRQPLIGEDHTIFEAFRTFDFWLLFISFLFGVGTGMTVMNNMGQMGVSLGYTDVSIFVSLLSIAGFFGRIVSGSGSEYFTKKFGTPRPLWNAASQSVMAVGFILMALNVSGALYIGSIVVGFCYGIRLAITVPTASELFGLKYYGLIYNVIILNLPLGSFLFSGLLAGLLYDTQATETAGGGNTCEGAHCYRTVYVFMAIACIIGFFLDILLVFRTRNIYSKVRANKSEAVYGAN